MKEKGEGAKVRTQATPKCLAAVFSTAGDRCQDRALVPPPSTRCQASFSRPQFPVSSVYWPLCSVLTGTVPGMPMTPCHTRPGY